MYSIDPVSTMILGGIGALIAAGLLAGTRTGKVQVDRGCRVLARGDLLFALGMLAYLWLPAISERSAFVLMAHCIAAGCTVWGFGFRAMTGVGPMSGPMRFAQYALLAAMPAFALLGRGALEVYFPAAVSASAILFYVDMRGYIGSIRHRVAIGLHLVLMSLAASWALRAWGAWTHVGAPDPIGLYLPWGGEQFLLAFYGISPLAVAVQVLLLVNLKLTRDLREHAYVDALTGASSRRGLSEAWPGFERRARAAGRSIAVVMFDLDRFKAVNDTYGHLVGDDALRHVAAVARDVLRPGDHFARYGGEEFVLLLSVAGERDAVQVGERVRRAIECAPCRCGRLELPLTVSVGVALCEPDESLQASLARADRRLYEAKHAGRNRVVGSEALAA